MEHQLLFFFAFCIMIIQLFSPFTCIPVDSVDVLPLNDSGGGTEFPYLTNMRELARSVATEFLSNAHSRHDVRDGKTLEKECGKGMLGTTPETARAILGECLAAHADG